MTASSTSPNCVRSVDLAVAMDSRSIAAEKVATDYPMHEIRSSIFQLSVLAGHLSALFLRLVPLDPIHDEGVPPSTILALSSSDIASGMTTLLSALLDTSGLLSIDLRLAILSKMELNRRKYPAELCRGKAGKYTEYSDATGITKEEGQSTLHYETNGSTDTFSVAALTIMIREFAEERKWARFHLPRSLLLALMGELGELAELVQWKKDEHQTMDQQLLDKMGQEVADVTIYLLRLADVCGVQLQVNREE